MAAKYTWTPAEEQFIRENYHRLTNAELAQHLNQKLQTLRMKLYEMGLYRMQLEYWSEDEIAFLVNNYREMGDMEIAELLNHVSPKQKQWTKKHIEKKRNYLGLHRTNEELKAIKQRNKQIGYWKAGSKKAWNTRGMAPDGDIRLWRRENGKLIPFIKVRGAFVSWSRWAWQQHYGAVPKKMHVAYKVYELSMLTDINNLELVSRAEMAKRNARFTSTFLSDNYVAGVLTVRNPQLRQLVKQDKGLIEIKRQQLILERTIKNTLCQTKI